MLDEKGIQTARWRRMDGGVFGGGVIEGRGGGR